MLDKLKPASSGADGLPYWFLQLAACSIAEPLAYLYNLSLSTGVVPDQWKKAVINPMPKISLPLSCSDFRPISLTPTPSRIFEKLVVQNVLYSIFRQPSLSELFLDQYAFRPTGSTQAAIIAILHHVTTLLETSPYVRIFALDFSKAFDTLRHSSILSKLSSLPIQDQYYN